MAQMSPRRHKGLVSRCSVARERERERERERKGSAGSTRVQRVETGEGRHILLDRLTVTDRSACRARSFANDATTQLVRCLRVTSSENSDVVSNAVGVYA